MNTTNNKPADIRLNDVTIHVRSTQKSKDHGVDGIEFFTDGAYYRKNGTHFIRYTEMGEGMERVNTTVKVEGNERVTVTRHDGGPYQIVLTKGERQHAFYNTGYGDLLLGVSGTKIRADLGENGGSLHLEYMLDINNAVASHNTLDIRVTPTQR